MPIITEEFLSDEISLNKIIRMMQDNIYKTFGYGHWLVETFSTFVILEWGDDYYRVPLVDNDDGCMCETDKTKWTVVERLQTWSEKVKTAEDEWLQQLVKTMPVADDLLDPKHLVKEVIDDDGTIYLEGYHIIYGSDDERDQHGHYFSKNTSGVMDIFKQLGKLPVLFDHTLNPFLRNTVIGEVTEMTEDEIGVFQRIQITKVKLYERLIQPFVQAKKMGSSAGCHPASYQLDEETGEILKWLSIESSFTVTPADSRQVSDRPYNEVKSAEDVLRYFEEIGCSDEELQTVKSLLPNEDSIDMDSQDNNEESTGVEETHDDSELLKARQRQLELELNLIQIS